jgi:tetratricopeptide (TPR) repeat protein
MIKAWPFSQKNAQAYFNRAYCKRYLSNYSGAIEDYTEAIALDPRNSDAYNNRGFVKHLMKNDGGRLSRL